MSDLRKQWAIVQQRPRPLSPAETRRIHEACLSLGITGYERDVIEAAVVAATPRPMRVYRDELGRWIVYCRLCGVATDFTATQQQAIDAALWELHEGHGCPNRRTTGEPCDTACIHCHGWQWCAEPNEKSDW